MVVGLRVMTRVSVGEGFGDNEGGDVSGCGVAVVLVATEGQMWQRLFSVL